MLYVFDITYKKVHFFPISEAMAKRCQEAFDNNNDNNNNNNILLCKQ